MRPELEALARRAVACPRWRWMPGMRWIVQRSAPLDDLWCRVHEADPARPGNPRPGWTPYPAAVPDFSDPATLGCLLALIREVWGDDTLSIAYAGGGWYVVQRVRHGIEALRWIDTATEAEALVTALEAAP